MAESLVTYFVQTFDLLLSEEAKLLSGLDDQVRSLHDELGLIRCFIRDADLKRKTNKRVDEWVRLVIQLAYDAEDVIDVFALKIEQQRQRNIGLKIICYPSKLISLHKLGKKIEDINRRSKEISTYKSKYGIKLQESGETSSPRQRRRAPIVEEHDVVGFQNEAAELATTLLTREEEHQRLVVVSIVGMGGLGKTTLAKKVYNRDDVKNHFNSCAWVYVSQDFRIEDILQATIKQVKTLTFEERRDLEKLGEEELGKMLCDHLKQGNCLVAFDDLWKESDWDRLKIYLPVPEVSQQSRVLLTTRNENVAKYADPLSNPHRLRLLDENESLKLFLSKVFSVSQETAETSSSIELVDLGKQIVAKCGGLPLAIVVLGGLLSTKERNPSVWRRVFQRANWHLNQESKNCREVLELSYTDLPYYLKHCFLYFGLFPEDYEINCNRLIRLWVAEGFIQQIENEIMEDVAKDCLEELIQRSMIQAVRPRVGGVEKCRIHDLLRDLAITEAKQCKFFDIYGNHSSLSPDRIRRLSIQHEGENCDAMITEHLRSFLCFSESFEMTLRKSFYGGFKLLRVLDLYGAKDVRSLPKEIGQLILLKYMSLARTKIKNLPHSVGNLYKLQTIDISNTGFRYVPNVIWKLPKLRHILANGRYPLSNEHPILPRINCQNHLLTLKVQAGSCIEGGLHMLTKLRELSIVGNVRKYENALSSSIVKLKSLEVLCFEVPQDVTDPIPLISLSQNVHIDKIALIGRLESLLPPNLTELWLAFQNLENDPMVTLEKLPNLKVLRIHRVFKGKTMICSAGGFPNLHDLGLSYMSNLEHWMVQQGAMPKLRDLQLIGIPLKMLPDGFNHLTALENLRIDYYFKYRVEESVGKDWDKIRNISSVSFIQSSTYAPAWACM